MKLELNEEVVPAILHVKVHKTMTTNRRNFMSELEWICQRYAVRRSSCSATW